MGSASTQKQAQGQTMSRGERLSAFIDGESSGDFGNLGQFLAEMTKQDRDSWSEYHLIGDALRSDDLAVSPARSSAFMASFSTRLESEAHVLAPAALAVKSRGGVFRKRFVPAFAVAAAAATLTWIVVPQLQRVDSHAGAQVASVSDASVQRVAMAPVPTANTRLPVVEANIIRDADLDQYLEAHQQFSQQPSMPGSMPLIRAAAVSQGQ